MRIRTPLTVFVVVAMIGLIASPTAAQDKPAFLSPSEEISRAGKIELFAIARYNTGDSEATPSGAAILDFDGGFGGGIGLGGNLTDHLNLNFEAIFESGDFTFAGGNPPSSDPNMFSLMVNLDYNVLKTRLTPVITGGVGVWDLSGSWPGSSTVRLKEEHFAYNYGVGVRWDMTPKHFLKVIYRRVVTELGIFDDTHEFDTLNIYLGVTY